VTTKPTGFAQLESELSVLFRRARQVFRTAAVEVHPDLTVASYATLTHVVERGPIRAATLVDHFGTDKGTMSRQLAQLAKLGLVRRTQDPDDGRAQAVTATPAALDRCARAHEHSRARLRRRMTGWPADRVDRFADLLHEFNVALAIDLTDADSRAS
jgi:DNA-binding MarR family transcriptional regulator